MNEEKIPYGAMLNHMSKKFKCAFKEEAAKHNINATFAHIVMTLSWHPEGLPQNDIAERNHLAAPTVSLTLKQMEMLGYITRRPSNDDNRKTIVILTDLGYELDEKIKDCFRIVESKMISNISSDDLAHFEKVLKMMNLNLQEEKEGDE